LDWDIIINHHTTTPQTRFFFLYFEKKKKERKTPFEKQPPPKQASLLDLLDNAFCVVEMPNVALRKNMTPKVPSTPFQEKMDFHPHRHLV